MESSYHKRILVIPAKAGIQRYATRQKSGSALPAPRFRRDKFHRDKFSADDLYTRIIQLLKIYVEPRLIKF